MPWIMPLGAVFLKEMYEKEERRSLDVAAAIAAIRLHERGVEKSVAATWASAKVEELHREHRSFDNFSEAMEREIALFLEERRSAIEETGWAIHP